MMEIFLHQQYGHDANIWITGYYDEQGRKRFMLQEHRKPPRPIEPVW